MTAQYLFDMYALICLMQDKPSYKRFADSIILTTQYNLIELYYSVLHDYNENKARSIYQKLKNCLTDVSDDTIFKAMAFRLKMKRNPKPVFNTPANSIKPHKHWILLFDVTNFRLKKTDFSPQKRRYFKLKLFCQVDKPSIHADLIGFQQVLKTGLEATKKSIRVSIHASIFH